MVEFLDIVIHILDTLSRKPDWDFAKLAALPHHDCERILRKKARRVSNLKGACPPSLGARTSSAGRAASSPRCGFAMDHRSCRSALTNPR